MPRPGAARTHRGRVALACVLIAAAGCGSGEPALLPVIPFSIDVTVNGKPPARAVVVLHPTTNDSSDWLVARPRAVVGSDGVAVFTTYRVGDGAPEGEYIATVVWPSPGPTPGENDPPRPDLLRGQYAEPTRSRLRITVGKSPERIVLKLPPSAK